MVPHQSLCVVTTSKYELQEEELEVWGGVKTDTRVTTQNNASPPGAYYTGAALACMHVNSPPH